MLKLDITFLLAETVQTANKDATTHSLYDVMKDFVLPVVVALVAAWIAYYVFYRGSQLEKQKTELQRRQTINDKLSYFTALLRSIYKTADQQKEFLMEWINLAKADDVNFPIMTFLTLQDLNRLIGLDPEAYLLAFAEHFAGDRPTAIKNFQKILNICDFLHDVFQSLKDQLKNGQEFDFERKTKYQELFYNAYNSTGQFMLELEANPSWRDRLNGLMQDFDKNHSSNYDISFYDQYYFVPVNAFCVDYLSASLPLTPTFHIVATATRDGKQAFDHIKAQNQQLLSDFTEEYEKIDLWVKELEQAMQPLLADF